MRFRTTVLVAVTSVLTALSPVSPVSAQHTDDHHSTDNTRSHSAAVDWAFVRREVFDVPLVDFIAHRIGGDPWFDWTTDGCSAVVLGNSGFSHDFGNSCIRHDFAYRNLKLLEQRYGTGRSFWNTLNRKRADQQFRTDMRAHCKRRSWLLRLPCYTWAEVYFRSVRLLGGP